MTDNIDAGEMAAKEMLELLYDAGNSPTDPLEVGIQLSSDSSQAMVNRVSGFLNFWAGNAPEQWEIVQDIRVNGGDTKKAQSDASALLRENADIKGFFGCNNTSTVGIVNTLFEEERTDVVLVGFDLADETKQMLAESGVSCSDCAAETGSDGISGNAFPEFSYKGRKIRAEVF